MIRRQFNPDSESLLPHIERLLQLLCNVQLKIKRKWVVEHILFNHPAVTHSFANSTFHLNCDILKGKILSLKTQRSSQ